MSSVSSLSTTPSFADQQAKTGRPGNYSALHFGGKTPADEFAAGGAGDDTANKTDATSKAEREAQEALDAQINKFKELMARFNISSLSDLKDKLNLQNFKLGNLKGSGKTKQIIGAVINVTGAIALGALGVLSLPIGGVGVFALVPAAIMGLLAIRNLKNIFTKTTAPSAEQETKPAEIAIGTLDENDQTGLLLNLPGLEADPKDQQTAEEVLDRFVQIATQHNWLNEDGTVKDGLATDQVEYLLGKIQAALAQQRLTDLAPQIDEDDETSQAVLQLLADAVEAYSTAITKQSTLTHNQQTELADLVSDILNSPSGATTTPEEASSASSNDFNLSGKTITVQEAKKRLNSRFDVSNQQILIREINRLAQQFPNISRVTKGSDEVDINVIAYIAKDFKRSSEEAA